jgi:hypothetical protein
VAVGEAPLSNGQGNGLILANNKPSGSTPVGLANPPPTPPTGSGTTDVIGTVADLLPAHAKSSHKPA